MTDLFDTARSTFTTPDDLRDRLILVVPREMGKANGKDGGEYEYVTGDTIVIDGPVTDQIPGPFPFLIEDMRWSASMVVAQLKPKIRAGRMLLGRVHGQPSSFNKKVDAFALREPESADLQPAREAAQWYQERQSASDPFA